uniref:Uncharacterized protein n=1 Tax=Arundo donax TaxID=35708 RepID=A0A0A9B4B3_ARUDO
MEGRPHEPGWASHTGSVCTHLHNDLLCYRHGSPTLVLKSSGQDSPRFFVEGKKRS